MPVPGQVAARLNVPVTGTSFDTVPEHVSAPAIQGPTAMVVPPAPATAHAAFPAPPPTRQLIHHTEQVRLWRTHVALYKWRLLLEMLRPGSTQTLKESGRSTAAYIKLIKSMELSIGPISDAVVHVQ